DSRRVWATMAWLPLAWNLGGLLLATQVMPGLVVSSLRAQGELAAKKFGDSHKVARILSAIGHGIADRIDPPSAPAPAVEPPPPLRAPDHAASIAVPFSAAGNAILMDVELQGPAGRITLPYLFDTGASFTTVHSKTA